MTLKKRFYSRRDYLTVNLKPDWRFIDTLIAVQKLMCYGIDNANHLSHPVNSTAPPNLIDTTGLKQSSFVNDLTTL